jgi:hypothetical protein
MTGEQRYAWTLGSLSGAIVVGAIVFVYSLFSSWEFHPAMVLVGIPFGLLTTWRVSRFVRLLRQGAATPFRGPLEGFVLMFLSATAYLSYNIFKAHVAGVEPQGWGWPFWRQFVSYVLFYAVLTGTAGAVVGAVLEMLTVLVVEFRPPKRTRVP